MIFLKDINQFIYMYVRREIDLFISKERYF